MKQMDQLPGDQPFYFEDIQWRQIDPSDSNYSQLNQEATRLILEHGGKPTRIIANDYAEHLPTRFVFNAAGALGQVTLEYMPNWDVYTVGGFTLSVPEDHETLDTDLEAVMRYELADMLGGPGEDEVNAIKANAHAYLTNRTPQYRPQYYHGPLVMGESGPRISLL